MTSEQALPRWTRNSAHALATDDRGHALLVRVAPGYRETGRWTLPGGGLDFGEDPAAGAVRELTEETGLTSRIVSLVFVDSRTQPPRPEANLGEWHGIRIVYRVEITGGELRDEIDGSTDAAAWFTREELQSLPIVDLVAVALEHLEKE